MLHVHNTSFALPGGREAQLMKVQFCSILLPLNRKWKKEQKIFINRDKKKGIWKKATWHVVLTAYVNLINALKPHFIHL